jgi:hypothetical protein
VDVVFVAGHDVSPVRRLNRRGVVNASFIR